MKVHHDSESLQLFRIDHDQEEERPRPEIADTEFPVIASSKIYTATFTDGRRRSLSLFFCMSMDVLTNFGQHPRETATAWVEAQTSSVVRIRLCQISKNRKGIRRT